MKTTKWLVAGALVTFGGMAVAGDEHEKPEMQQEGEEVRTGMEQNAEQAEEKIDETADQAQDQAEEIGEKATGRAEAMGSGLAESAEEANSAIQGEPSQYERGALADGEVNNTLTLNPLGFVTGSGLDVTYARPISQKISALGSAALARTSAGDGSATRVGLRAGLDYFLIGQNNEGLSIGPRVETAFGAETSGANSAFGGLGVSGELGYRWISAKGLTAGLGAGVSAGFGGTSDNGSDAPKDEGVDNFDADVNPYARINLGYSW